MAAEPLSSSEPGKSNEQSFAARGVVKELKPGDRTVLVSHEAIINYMDSMTMPFKVKESKELTGLQAGDRISFRLHVTETESWIGQIAKIGIIPMAEARQPRSPAATEVPKAGASHPLLTFKFTNELGQAVSLGEFRGQALAITFFFTRCPIPDYCPRLSKNFQEASRNLSSMAGGPTNWHFLSVSFDTEIDNPRVLKAYGEMYHYDPAHWSFLTGPADKIGELARLSDVTFERDGGSFNHNFRTLIIDPSGHLQMAFPTGGNLSGAIVDEVLKAAALTNRVASRNSTKGEPDEARNAKHRAGSARFHGG
ncbi:MAG TPA: SCO family protein [Candidatus Binatia bacterium]|nr:SCO family protein [Candidatus Binatia bacterium]